MSARLARSAFASLRASARPRTNYALHARRNMSAQSHGAQPKSDMPWIVGAAVVFGPVFLYLVSPSARKSQSQHAVHNDHHDYPNLKKEAPSSQEHSKEIMKDDEGTPADVTASIALAEESDVPKDSQSPETVAETTTAAEQDPVGEEENKETATAPEAAPTDTESASAQAPTATEKSQA